MKKSYLGVCITPRKLANRNLATEAQEKFKNPFSSDADRQYMSLGSRLRLAAETGESVGVEITPTYNGNDTDDLDVNSSFTHDIFDIAEQYGKLVDAPNPVEPTDTNKTE